MDYQDYFWLNDAQKAKMAAARSAATDFGYIGLFSIGKAWKRHVEGMVGSKVQPENYLRAFNCARTVHFGSWNNPREVRALIRLSKKQAMMMKLQHGGSNVAWVRDDPDGRLWGWLSVLEGSNWPRTDHARQLISEILLGDMPPYQPENMVPYAEMLPHEMRTAFMWKHAEMGWRANNPARKPLTLPPVTDVKKFGLGVIEQHPDSDWHVPAETIGKLAARQFWVQWQNKGFRGHLWH